MSGQPGRSGGKRNPPGGRPKGALNKLNRDVRALVIGALHKAGGVNYLCDRAFDQPVAFMALIGRILPLQVTGKDGGALHVEFRWADEPDTKVSTAVVGAIIDASVSDETNNVSDETGKEDELDLIEWAKPEAAD